LRNIAILIIFVLFNIFFALGLFFPVASLYLLQNPTMIPLLFNIWGFIAIMNILFKQRFGMGSAEALLFTAIIVFSGIQGLRPSPYFVGYSFYDGCKYF